MLKNMSYRLTSLSLLAATWWRLYAYSCRAYPLKYSIPKTQKLETRAHIGHLVCYNPTNIFQVCIPSLVKVICTWDITFNNKLFYNLIDIDASQILPDELQQVIKIIELLYTML